MVILPKLGIPHPPLAKGDSASSKPTRPHIHLRTPEAKSAPISIQGSRPVALRSVTSPPTSPTRIRASTMPTSDPKMLHDSGAVTPPPTPTKSSHSKSVSTSSADSLSSLRRGDSTSSTSSRRRQDSISYLNYKGRARGISIDESESPGSTALREFKHWISDYEIPDKKKPLGSGLWSDVYLARPCMPKPSSCPPSNSNASSSTPSSSRSSLDVIMSDDAFLTPPLTPTSRSRQSSLSSKRCHLQLPSLPSAYAIKTPASRSAKAVLTAEAHILSYLSRFPNSSSSEHIITFFGQDTRTSALVLKAMDTTLESWTTEGLNTMAEGTRTKTLAGLFPAIAERLLEGLEWMNERGVVHADIKPSNILLSIHPPSSSSSTFEIVFSDFSSAILTTPTACPTSPPSTESKPATPLGGGTWDFLDPTLLSSSTTPSSPSPTSDLYALAQTLLYLLLGTSPFGCAGSNIYRRRELVKQGSPLSYIGYGDDGLRNLGRVRELSEALDWDVQGWFGRVLVKDVGRRVGIREWRGEVEEVGRRVRV